MSSQVVAIVPAYNEEKTIGGVVKTLVDSGVFQEVIVVDDGSQDATALLAETAGASRVIRSESNSGKGQTMLLGVRATTAEIICFFDGDLIGLTVDHIRSLTEPVVAGRLAMNVGTVDRGAIFNTLARRLPAVSGQRVLRREIFTNIPARYIGGFGIEVALNYCCRLARLPIGRIFLPGVSMIRKVQKVGWWSGLLAYARMWWSVLGRWLRVRLDRKNFFID
ncbi:glycosyltransferase family 2 protein [Patescibacteria group bacterium]|nr:glycosyltransferase family 2 protein [Patescibacteria group bacterium]MBU1029522.1 glycosyltransferase family 2 protein [Patescibacteria group bacterium]MBU1916163.1 glycosyltransferase family 2 protein [Patescibacteria group bacterium]